MRKPCDGKGEIAILSQFLAIEPHFVRKGTPDALQIAILIQILAIEPHFVRKLASDPFKIAILPQPLAIEPHFVRKCCARTSSNRKVTAVFGDGTSFRAKGLRFVPSRWPCPVP